METDSVNRSCKLCFSSKCAEVKTKGNVELANKIEKYLQIKMEYRLTGLCLNCYNSLENFHEFYEMVHTAQKKLLVSLNEDVENTDEKSRIILNDEETTKEVVCSKLEQTEDVCCDSEQMKLVKNGENDEGSENKLRSIHSKSKKLKSVKDKEICSEIEKKMMEFYNIKCEKCEDGKFTSFKMLNKHYMNVHNTQGYIKCCKRNIRVNDKYYLRSHMLKHLQPDTCRCRVCGKELSSLATLKHHMILHKPTEQRPFQCKDCDKRFCCKNDLKNHEKAIHLPKSEREDFICDVCGKVFQKFANLRYHHSTVHLRERKYICEICAKCFTTQSGLRTHISAAHSTLDPIQCHECHKWLKTKDTFQKHLQLHQNNTYPCAHCVKVCNSSASLRSHLVKHSEERPYSCATCRKSFKTKTHLKNHSTQHIAGKHYKCPYCSKLFVSMSNYYTHRRRIHSGERTNIKQYDNTVLVKKERVTSEDTNLENGEQNFNYDQKTVKNNMENNAIVLQVPIIRQNIIVSPCSIK